MAAGNRNHPQSVASPQTPGPTARGPGMLGQYAVLIVVAIVAAGGSAWWYAASAGKALAAAALALAAAGAMVFRLHRLLKDLSAAREAGAEFELRLKETAQAAAAGQRKLASEVADRRRVEQALREAKEVAEKAARVKSEFLANMSHEIRTPMNGMLGMTELLLNSELTRKQKHFGETIRRCGEHLLTIINDILDISKIEAGKLQLHETVFDLRLLVEEAGDLFAEAAHRKGLELTSVFPVDLHSVYRGDVYRLKQILTNLLGNAVKFTERGEVVIRVSGLGEEADRSLLRIEVRDTGIGVRAEVVPRLFEAFSQVDASSTRHHGGTGLGLAICRQLTQLMGGEIGVDSTHGKGSTFWFTVRLPKAAAVPGQERPTAAARSLQGVRALIVDDNATSREALAAQLRAWGMQADATAEGQRALSAMRAAAARGTAYEVAIFDRGMPGMNGVDLVRQVKADRGIADARLVMMTSVGDLEESGQWLAMGVDAYLDKPLRQLELRKCLARVIGRSERAAQLPLAVGEETSSAFNAHILLAEDNLVNQELAVNILEAAGCRVKVVPDGRQAVEAITDSPLDLMRDPYDLVFMDCQMPEMDGYSATGAIRHWEAATRSPKRLPIVALTANAMEGDRERCLKAGMNDYLAKPFNRAQFLDMLRRWLPLQAVAGAATAAAPSNATLSADAVAEAPGPAVMLDRQALDRIVSLQRPGAPDVLGHVIRLFLESSPRLVTGMRTALDRGDAEGLRTQAHTLKSGAANLGANALSELCREVERIGKEGRLEGAADKVSVLEFEFQGVCQALKRELARRAAA